MIMGVDMDGNIQLEQVYTGIGFLSDNGEKLFLTMRDGGFEFKYQGKWYSAKQSVVESFESIANNSRADISEAQSDGEAELPTCNK